MAEINLNKILACPRCKTTLKSPSTFGTCPKCHFKYQKKNNIWHLLYQKNAVSQKSQAEYDQTHTHRLKGPNDGSYQILAAFAKGNKTVDIACGQGYIENLAPETVGVEFSQNALKVASKNGAKHLVLADAHALPFKNDSFELSISAGSLEHFSDPQKAIHEMVRVSKIQILTVHRHPPIPFAEEVHKLITILFKIKHQPIENPVSEEKVVKMLQRTGTHVVFKGVWTIPINYGRVIKFLPEFKNIPACSFVIAFKK